MGSVFYVMMIMGCGDGAVACTPVRPDATHYASAAQCQVAMPDVLRRVSDIDYPELAAACQASGPTMVDAKRPARRG